MVQGEKPHGEKADIQTIIQISLDVLDILTDRFRQEMGRQFDIVWKDCLKGMKGFSREIFHDIHPDKENLDMNTYIIKSRYDGFEGEKDEEILIDAFNTFIGELIASIKKYLGEGIVKNAVQDAIRVLSMVEKYKQGTTIGKYYIEKLEGSI